MEVARTPAIRLVQDLAPGSHCLRSSGVLGGGLELLLEDDPRGVGVHPGRLSSAGGAGARSAQVQLPGVEAVEIAGYEQEGIRPEDAAHEEQLAPIA
jgi:hypothetical protein